MQFSDFLNPHPIHMVRITLNYKTRFLARFLAKTRARRHSLSLTQIQPKMTL
ncbi:hypothetical protein K469DRAFT_302503 [Zopfia rhizophila CBS 207.26]|uniref:Uncharacterized protein n=1 Tax=Zopfia rhizophila CBS 207.26 TaxID=1314779 RepID=A0A6A6DLZ9_9PEZI|nr:hypothetical protein K469DRAFT_302503 [Zopfia rhizophila CBS 207.26]